MVESRTVKLSSPDRILYPEDGITKGDVFEYYKQVGSTIVPHLRDRPFTMKRYPHGITGEVFFQKQAPRGMPDWIPTRQFRTWPREGGSRLAVIPPVNERTTLLLVVEVPFIDLTALDSRRAKPDLPDFVPFNLEPPDDPHASASTIHCARLTP